jgi:putative transcriptional regulator
MSESLAGRLLVATPVIGDPNFERTVVFLLGHDHDGALGIVVNRPTDVDVEGSLPQWASISAPPAVVFVGGPVEQAGAIGLGRPAPGVPLQGRAPGDWDASWSPIPDVAEAVGPLATLDLHADPALSPGLEAVRVYAGHSGWGPGQLESEIAHDAWIVADAVPPDLWSDRPELLWGQVLHRQGGAIAWLALSPRDPTTN